MKKHVISKFNASTDLVDSFNIMIKIKSKEKMMQDALTGYETFTDDELAMLEQLLRYKLRTYIGQYRSLPDGEVETEVEKFKSFMRDPIGHIKTEDKKSS